MKNTILEYIIKEFGDNKPKDGRIKHYSYCLFPEMDCTCKDLNEIQYDTSLINGGYIDSFSVSVVAIFLEDTFNIKLKESDITPYNFNTINKMEELVKKYLNI